jgi:hypothetical protein
MRTSLVTFAMIIAAATCTEGAHAGSCRPLPALEVSVAEAKHIFVAQVRTASLSRDEKWVEGMHFVEEVLKGDATKVPMLRADFIGSNYLTREAPSVGAESPLLVGQRYLVFANEDGPVSISMCTKTQPLYNKYRNDIATIRNLISASNRVPSAK